ncbi:hypothetical protein B0T24DRAFT_686906 [Lasiosphaeria ovina]|uniref:AA1-like domain-containing protein n=1 Tax=Lasiosphaeria ovina TaxID=92902 RepID=A0AAE0NJU4_9PEZI|nr:hypothetical protein B0T24DRAFT_686906 [Lasiosphaeria ovina]
MAGRFLPLNLVLGLLLASLTASAPLVLGESRLQRRDARQSCSDASMNAPPWTAQDFDFHSSITFSTPAHQIVGGWVSFSLRNPALPFVMSCFASSSQLQEFFYGDQWFSCSAPPDAATASEAEFRFDRATGRFDISQNWICPDADPQSRITFNASGTTTVPLDCATSRWQNGNWSMDHLYSTESVECGLLNITIVPNDLEAWA